jgi:hypothetical protein
VEEVPAGSAKRALAGGGAVSNGSTGWPAARGRLGSHQTAPRRAKVCCALRPRPAPGGPPPCGALRPASNPGARPPAAVTHTPPPLPLRPLHTAAAAPGPTPHGSCDVIDVLREMQSVHRLIAQGCACRADRCEHHPILTQRFCPSLWPPLPCIRTLKCRRGGGHSAWCSCGLPTPECQRPARMQPMGGRTRRMGGRTRRMGGRTRRAVACWGMRACACNNLGGMCTRRRGAVRPVSPFAGICGSPP